MEEVRSYWQVASITHFCTIFQKPFKLPIFEPEELEQAFILDVPAPLRSSTFSHSSAYSSNITKNEYVTELNDDARKTNGKLDAFENGNGDSDNNETDIQDESPDYEPPKYSRIQRPPSPQPQLQSDEQQDLHLLVKLAIALLKPHFNSKISPLNWENYLCRLIDLNWVELENCPSPFNVPIISSDGIELTKNLSFNELSLSDKIDVFCALCDYRLWCDDASDLIKDYTVEELRLESVGKDQHGYEYWYFSGTRLFRESKELSQDLIFRKKRIKELEYKLIELEKSRILKEKEDQRKAEIERAKQLANEAREARLATKRQQEQDALNESKRKKTSGLAPTRTGLRERRSSAVSNNNETESTPTRTLRSRAAKQQQSETELQHNAPKANRCSSKRSKDQSNSSKIMTPEPPKKSLEEECREELEKLRITPDERKDAWQVLCDSLEEWENFALKFERTKSSNEKYLSKYVNETLLPLIRGIYAKRASEVKRKEKELLLSLATRRVSTRIISKRAQEEEEERQAQIREAEIQRKKAEAETRLKAELEREIRAKKNRFVINGGTSSACSEDGEETGRYNLRHQHDANDGLIELDGLIHPDNLSEFYEALELIVDSVRVSKHAWPFVNPVPETVPGYYDLIEEPMDLKKIRTKVEFREYRSLIELENDFKLLVNNCERFNGPKNVYTKMVYKLWKSFRKNVQLYLQRDLHMNEYESFVYPPTETQLPQPTQLRPETPPQVQDSSPPPPIASPIQSIESSPLAPLSTFSPTEHSQQADKILHPTEEPSNQSSKKRLLDSSSHSLNSPIQTSNPQLLRSDLVDLYPEPDELIVEAIQSQPEPIHLHSSQVHLSSELLHHSPQPLHQLIEPHHKPAESIHQSTELTQQPSQLFSDTSKAAQRPIDPKIESSKSSSQNLESLPIEYPSISTQSLVTHLSPSKSASELSPLQPPISPVQLSTALPSVQPSSDA